MLVRRCVVNILNFSCRIFYLRVFEYSKFFLMDFDHGEDEDAVPSDAEDLAMMEEITSDNEDEQLAEHEDQSYNDLVGMPPEPPADFSVGSKVEVCHSNGGWYSATIKNKDEGFYKIIYVDGEIEEDVPASRIVPFSYWESDDNDETASDWEPGAASKKQLQATTKKGSKRKKEGLYINSFLVCIILKKFLLSSLS